MLSKMVTATMLSVGLGMTASAHSQTNTSNCCLFNLPCCEQGQACCHTSTVVECSPKDLACCDQAEKCCLDEKACCEKQLTECENGGNCCIEKPTANSPPQ
ncbi:hypothetical protein [Gimesia sp.]|uniref:hypothetical protein n=1 Tax=Gimesia sp. TaxID=2024833 RepID=UPI003A91BB90